MASLTTRAGKGSPLTNNELDANFNNLNSEVTPARPTIRPSLSLDFANSKSVDSRITFTRASSATRYDANGVLQKVVNDQPRIDFDPSTGECKGLLVEEQRTNRVNYSSAVNQALSWGVRVGTVVTPNSALAPDGTMTASLVHVNSGDGYIYRLDAGVALSATHTISLWAKKATSTATTIQFNMFFGGNPAATSGVVSLTSEWVRYTFTGTPAFLAGAQDSGFYIQGGDALVWGAQLEQGAFATSYIPSTDTFTSRASSATYFDSTGTLRYAGVNQPRYGYGYDTTSGKWVSQGLVLESAATNLISYGNTLFNFNTEAGGGGVVVTRNVGDIASPSGVLGEVLKVDNSALTDLTYSDLVHYVGGGQTYAGTTKTFSVWLKGTTGQTIQIKLDRYGNSGTYANIVLNSYWTRYSVTFSIPANSVDNLMVRIGRRDLGSIGATNAVVFYAWGAQIEDGYVPTSYIPTYGASATRAADVSSSAQTTRAGDKAVVAGNALTNAINPIEGSLVWSRSRSAVGALPELTLFADGGSGTDFYYKSLAWMNTAQSCNVTSLNNSVSQFSQTVTIPTDLSVVTTAFAYAENNMAASINGSSPTTDTAASVQQGINTLGLAIPGSNNSNQHIRKVAYYPKRLTNAQLQALTA